jgi:hypothetical protein
MVYYPSASRTPDTLVYVPNGSERTGTIIAATGAAVAGAGVIAVVVALFVRNASRGDDSQSPHDSSDDSNQPSHDSSDDGTQVQSETRNNKVTLDNGVLYHNSTKQNDKKCLRLGDEDDEHYEDCRESQIHELAQAQKPKQISPSAFVLNVESHTTKKSVDQTNAATLLVNKEELAEILALLDRKDKAYICPS